MVGRGSGDLSRWLTKKWVRLSRWIRTGLIRLVATAQDRSGSSRWRAEARIAVAYGRVEVDCRDGRSRNWQDPSPRVAAAQPGMSLWRVAVALWHVAVALVAMLAGRHVAGTRIGPAMIVTLNGGCVGRHVAMSGDEMASPVAVAGTGNARRIGETLLALTCRFEPASVALSPWHVLHWFDLSPRVAVGWWALTSRTAMALVGWGSRNARGRSRRACRSGAGKACIGGACRSVQVAPCR